MAVAVVAVAVAVVTMQPPTQGRSSHMNLAPTQQTATETCAAAVPDERDEGPPYAAGRACAGGASARVRSAARVKRPRQLPSCKAWRSSSWKRSRVAAALHPGRNSAPVEWLQLLQGGCSISLAMEGWTMPHHRRVIVGGVA